MNLEIIEHDLLINSYDLIKTTERGNNMCFSVDDSFVTSCRAL